MNFSDINLHEAGNFTVLCTQLYVDTTVWKKALVHKFDDNIIFSNLVTKMVLK